MLIDTLRKITLVLILLVVASVAISAQSLRAYTKAAENAFAKQDYFTALVYYKKLLEVDPTRTDIHFKYAESARLFQAYRLAEDAYHKIILSKDGSNYPLAIYYLGSVKKNLGKYDEASNYFTKYLKNHKKFNGRIAKLAERDLIDCRWAAKAIDSNLENITVEHIKGGINTPYSEFGAVEVEGELFFSSMRFTDKKNQMYSKLFKKNTSGELESFDFNKNGKFAANPSISFDGKRMYYTNCSYNSLEQIVCEIVYRDKNQYGEWGDEQELPGFINYPGYTTTHPSIGFDKINEREVLFFVSNRPGGKGKLDIWYSTVAPNGKLTRPQNHVLLNSRENDVTPFFHSTTQTLYFSSDGYSGMGGYDIYKVKRVGRSWQTPVHMVYPINSSYNDFYFSLNEKGSQSYFASNREEALEIDPENEACCNDLFSAKLKSDKIELTPEEFIVLNKPRGSIYVQEEVPDADDEPRVIIKTIPATQQTSGDDIPVTILDTEDENAVVKINKPKDPLDNSTNDGPNVPDEMNTKGELPIKVTGSSSTVEVSTSGSSSNTSSSSSTASSSSSTTNSSSTTPTTTTETSNVQYEENFETLSRDIYSLVFEVEILDWDLLPLNGATVEFIEKNETTDAKNFRKSNLSGNKVRFRIKDHATYQVVIKKSGYKTETYDIDQELLSGATELNQQFYMGLAPTGSKYPESAVSDELEAPVVTESQLNSYLPLKLYFDNNEPDPTSWSNTTNKNYEQTFLFYHSKKEKFKNQQARKYPSSQREQALDEVDYFFENELKKGYSDLSEFSDALFSYLESGNKVHIELQTYTTQKAVGNKNSALLKRRVSSIKNHFRNHLSGKLASYIDAGFLTFEVAAPNILPSSPNGIYSPESSTLRRVEIKSLTFNEF